LYCAIASAFNWKKVIQVIKVRALVLLLYEVYVKYFSGCRIFPQTFNFYRHDLILNDPCANFACLPQG